VTGVQTCALPISGNVQPAIPAWNPLGYFWNGWHRVGVVVEA